MKYRMYSKSILVGAIIIATLGLAACASTGDRKPDSVDSEQEEGQSERDRRYDGREPASLHGDFTWLNEVGEDFDRIASETSSRAIASEKNKEVLLQQKNWSFTYLPKNNQFYVRLNGETYKMVQTSIGDGQSFAFAAEGQTENPVTLSFVRAPERTVASGKEKARCNAEIAYWSSKAHNYMKESHQLVGKSCENLITKLKDYIP